MIDWRYNSGMFTILVRTEPEEAIDRWYLVAVQATLFDPQALILAWGSRQNAWQQVRVAPAASREQALQEAHKIVAQKVRRGYQIVVEK